MTRLFVHVAEVMESLLNSPVFGQALKVPWSVEFQSFFKSQFLYFRLACFCDDSKWAERDKRNFNLWCFKTFLSNPEQNLCIITIFFFILCFISPSKLRLWCCRCYFLCSQKTDPAFMLRWGSFSTFNFFFSFSWKDFMIGLIIESRSLLTVLSLCVCVCVCANACVYTCKRVYVIVCITVCLCAPVCSLVCVCGCLCMCVSF